MAKKTRAKVGRKTAPKKAKAAAPSTVPPKPNGANGLRRARMVAIIDECDFRSRPQSLWAEWIQTAANRKKADAMGDDECVLFVSGSGRYLAWVFPPRVGNSIKGLERKIYHYETLYIDGGSWHPYMLQNYGEQVGLDLGLKSFTELYEARKKRQRSG